MVVGSKSRRGHEPRQGDVTVQVYQGGGGYLEAKSIVKISIWCKGAELDRPTKGEMLLKGGWRVRVKNVRFLQMAVNLGK